MSTKVVGLPGIHRDNISQAAGIRPHQMDLVFAATSDFQAAKSSGTGGQVTSAMSAGDWYVNSGNGYSIDIQGAGSLQQLDAVSRTTISSAVAVSAGSSITLGTLVAAPGAGRVVVPKYITVQVPSGGANTSATDGSNWAVCYGDATGVSATANLNVSGLVSTAGARVVRMTINSLSALDTSVANQALVVCRIGNLALSGASTQNWTFTTQYDIVNVSA